MIRINLDRLVILRLDYEYQLFRIQCRAGLKLSSLILKLLCSTKWRNWVKNIFYGISPFREISEIMHPFRGIPIMDPLHYIIDGSISCYSKELNNDVGRTEKIKINSVFRRSLGLNIVYVKTTYPCSFFPGIIGHVGFLHGWLSSCQTNPIYFNKLSLTPLPSSWK